MSDVNSKLFIPNRINVGYQERAGTYTGKLAYVIYFDQAGKLRKEASWNSWRSKTIEPNEFDNSPIEGFVLNKKVGGVTESWGWNVRQEKVRVFDPRNFEIEISIPNLLFILRECDCSRGKGLEGKFCYAWSGAELILVPECSEDYKLSKGYTALQSKGVKSKEMIVGAHYLTKRMEDLIYVGKLDYYFMKYESEEELRDVYTPMRHHRQSGVKDQHGVLKRHVFYSSYNEISCFIVTDGLEKIGQLKSDTIVENYADIIDQWNKNEHASKVVALTIEPHADETDEIGHRGDTSWFSEDTPGVFTYYNSTSSYIHSTKTYVIDKIAQIGHYTIKNGVLTFIKDYTTGPKSNWSDNTYYRDGRYHNYPKMPFKEPVKTRLFATTENGNKFRVQSYTFEKGNGHG